MTSHRTTPPPNLIQRFLLLLIAAYKSVVSPLLPDVCRFHPSCSEYASQAIVTHGAVRGTALAAARLTRCHPLNEGGFDPVPPCAHSHRRD